VSGTTQHDPYAVDGAGTSTLELLESATRYNRWLASKLLPFLGSTNLELGAGHGTLTALIATDRDVVASEPSSACRGELARRFAQNPRVTSIVGHLHELPEGALFDSVYSANVLEHVADDVALIRLAAGHLRPGGRFVAIVPAGGWLYSPFDARVGHFRRYGHADRVRLASALRHGSSPLELLAFRPFNPIGALGWFFQMRLLGRDRLPPTGVEGFDRLVPVLKKLDHLPLGFGQNLLLALVKRDPS
jgi:SAM-dependent methyltransferase